MYVKIILCWAIVYNVYICVCVFLLVSDRMPQTNIYNEKTFIVRGYHVVTFTLYCQSHKVSTVTQTITIQWDRKHMGDPYKSIQIRTDDNEDGRRFFFLHVNMGIRCVCVRATTRS